MEYKDLQLNQIYKTLKRDNRCKYDYFILFYEEERQSYKGHYLKEGISFNFYPTYRDPTRMIETCSLYEGFIHQESNAVNKSEFINEYKYILIKNILNMNWKDLIKPYGEGYPGYFNNLLGMMCDFLK
jgi:hypothetical protein